MFYCGEGLLLKQAAHSKQPSQSSPYSCQTNYFSRVWNYVTQTGRNMTVNLNPLCYWKTECAPSTTTRCSPARWRGSGIKGLAFISRWWFNRRTPCNGTPGCHGTHCVDVEEETEAKVGWIVPFLHWFSLYVLVTLIVSIYMVSWILRSALIENLWR